MSGNGSSTYSTLNSTIFEHVLLTVSLNNQRQKISKICQQNETGKCAGHVARMADSERTVRTTESHSRVGNKEPEFEFF